LKSVGFVHRNHPSRPLPASLPPSLSHTHTHTRTLKPVSDPCLYAPDELCLWSNVSEKHLIRHAE